MNIEQEEKGRYPHRKTARRWLSLRPPRTISQTLLVLYVFVFRIYPTSELNINVKKKPYTTSLRSV